jgi:DNA-binding MarR family transcriptional regulator
MKPKPAQPPELTPDGRLSESGLHQIVGYELAQAAITTTQVFAAQVGEAFDLRPVEFTLLTLLEDNPGSTAKQLARALSVTPPNITMWVDRLEERGLVGRERSVTDRRAQHIRLTPRGTQLARKALRLLAEGEQAVLAPLSLAERTMLVELLHKVACCRTR